MNNAQIEEAIHKAFSSIQRLASNENLIRCERRIGSALVSIFYFDISDTDLDREFNLKQFMEKNLANDFYQNRGETQWNFYLIFVVNDERHQELISSGTTGIIERERSYARKFVVNEGRLSEFLKGTLAPASAPSLSLVDFAARWKNKLDQSGLAAVYSSSQRAPLIRSIREGRLETPTQSVDISETAPAFELAHIQALEVISYRSRIRPGKYELKQVNLLCGPNGAGKTSFLEAIELCICGQTSENQDEAAGTTLVVHYLDSRKDTFSTENRASDSFYRLRDRTLYGRVYSRGNHLAAAFARYNFFATDAAFRLAHQETAQEISKALTDFIVGPEVTALDERITKLKDDLAGECEKLDRELNELSINQDRVSNAIEEARRKLVSSESEIATVEEVSASIPFHSLHKTSVTNLSALRNVLGKVTPVIEFVSKDADWLRPLSMEALEKERVDLQRLRGLSDDILGVLSALEQEQTKVSGEIEAIQKLSEAHRQLRRYFSVPHFELVEGLEQNLEDLKNALKPKNRISPTLASLVSLAASTGDQGVNVYIGGLKAKLADARLRQTQTDSEINNINAALSTIRKHILALKEHSLAVLNASANDESCPLCKAQHGQGELRKAIDEISDSIVESSELSILLVKKADIESEIASIQSQIEQFSQVFDLLRVNKLLPEEVLGNSKIADLVLRLQSFETEIEQEAKKIETLQSVKSSLDMLGLSERHYRANNAYIRTKDPTFVLTADAAAINLVDKNLDTASKRLNAEIERLSQEMFKAKLGLQSALTEKFRGLHEIAYILKILPDRISRIDNAINALEGVASDLMIEPATDLLALGSLLRRGLTKVEDAMLLQSRAQESSTTLKREIDSLAEIQRQVPLKHRERENLDKVLNIIQEIQTNDGLEMNLRSFLQSYKQSIMEIFANIHQPREFTNIVLGDGGVEDIRLKRIGGAEVSLKQISTGQRSALALSIFLALHSSVRKKANLILIDDPVAHIDDLNSLSFIDHLRNLVLDGSQIIFATADHKLAKLFEMKFAFLSSTDQFQRLEFDIDGLITRRDQNSGHERTLH